ncbi:MAG: carbonic anhydrase [Acidobacteriota bacterium]|jgi:carbonic anhydrase|nr:carbonic anhydrase [Acidobacteriota bacterium]NLT33644.1 carbonic anhydrase [Acidobacteriota bacterium]
MSRHDGARMPRVSAAEGLERLLSGNRRYASGRGVHPHQDPAWREENVSGQHPFAVVLGCSDSRVPPEILFDCGLGDLFVVRTAGHCLDEAAFGSIQYAVEHLGVPLVVVLGHARCGAVTSALENEPVEGHMKYLIDRLRPVIDALPPPGDLERAIAENVRRTVAELKSEAWAREVTVLGLHYDLQSGRVRPEPPAGDEE